MKKVLYISYDFPPVGEICVFRSLKFVKYLGRFGWTPVVITTPPDNYGKQDSSLLKDLPHALSIYRLKAYNLRNLSLKLRKTRLDAITSGLFHGIIPDGETPWYWFNRNRILQIARNESIEAIVASGPPHSVFLLGSWLRERMSDVKFVADYRDEWTTNWSRSSIKNIFENNTIRTAIERGMERYVQKTADVIVTLSEKMRDSVHGVAPEQSDEKYHIIPNGYDEEDFVGLEDKQEFGELHFMYTGSFYGHNQPYTFLNAVAKLADDPETRIPVRISFIGQMNREPILKHAAEIGLTGAVEIHGYMPHDQVLEFQTKASVLLMVVGTAPGADRIFTGKLFEYIRFNRPILALVPPDGVAADVIRSTCTGFVADYSSEVDTTQAIRQIAKLWKNGTLDASYRSAKKWNVVREYSRESTAKKMASLLDELTAH